MQGKLADPSSYKPEHLNAYLKQLFSIADENGDGVLEPDELKTLLQLCGFDLSAKEIEDFVNAADTNHDGVIEYDEFVPVATKMLKSKNKKIKKRRKKEKKKIKKALPHASKFKAADLDKYVHDLFAIGDTNGDGVLEPRELKKLLQMSGFKLSAKEIHTFVQQADTNNDGVIEYREFAPVMSAMLQLSEKPKVNWPALAAVVITALVRLGAGQKGKEGQEIKEEEA